MDLFGCEMRVFQIKLEMGSVVAKIELPLLNYF